MFIYSLKKVSFNFISLLLKISKTLTLAFFNFCTKWYWKFRRKIIKNNNSKSKWNFELKVLLKIHATKTRNANPKFNSSRINVMHISLKFVIIFSAVNKNKHKGNNTILIFGLILWYYASENKNFFNCWHYVACS